MSSQRISLSRILAINWYGFRQVIDVADHTLIAGTFGTGKTALLDLIQHVLLGEHWRPNRAAAGNARSRTLVSYCLCDTNTVRDGQPHHTRPSGVTVIGLEFTWPAEGGRTPRRETWGMRVEFASATSEPRRTYFLVPDRLEWADLAPDGRLLDEDEFRSWIRREFEAGSPQRCLFSRQQDYLAEMATPRHLYFDSEPFQKTLVKAIAFEPEANVEEFIRRFILEESPLDVRDVKAAQDAYRETEARLRRQESEAAFLRRIADAHRAHAGARREESVQSWIRHALDVAQLAERITTTEAELRGLQEEFDEDRRRNEEETREREGLAQTIGASRLEASQDPEQRRLDEQERRQQQLAREVADLRDAAREVERRLADRHQHWTRWLRHGGALPVPGVAELLAIDPALLESLRQGEVGARLEALRLLAARFQELRPDLRKVHDAAEAERNAADERLKVLAAELESIGLDRSPGRFPVLEAVQARVGGRARQFGRLVEVTPDGERWWPALELLLGARRWSIIVGSEDYHAALEVARRTAPGREAEALVNPLEVLSPRLAREMQDGSLAARVEVTHPLARAYADHLLGDVLCVESDDQLDRTEAPRAITPEAHLKDAPVRLRLSAGRDVPLTLGRRGLERMRQARETEQVAVRAQRDAADRRCRDLRTWIDAGLQDGLGDGSLPDRSADLPRLAGLARDLGAVEETIRLLSTPERAARLQRLRDLEARHRQLDNQIAVRNNRLAGFEQKARPLRERLERATEELRTARIEQVASRQRVTGGLSDHDLDTRLQTVLTVPATWERRREAVLQSEASARERAVEARLIRQRERLALLAARDASGNLLHPEYQTDFDPEDDDNAVWDARLELLETVELANSRTLAADRRRDWERRLQEGVLDRLNEKLQEADRTIRQLRDHLNQRVGRHVYRISQRRDPAFAALWSLLDSGLAPGDPLLQGVKSDEIERARKELMDAVEAGDRQDDRSRRLLDYRFYHRYDLEMVNAEQPDAPAISLGRSGRSLSGGESQAPFFISMLAAFRRVYAVGSSRVPHLGLVVMDEAFSKLSGDGVEDCLALARSFGLQLVMAFPVDRLGVMAPHADTLIVCRKEEERDAAGYIREVRNIPVILPPEEAMEAIV